jgi:hypothetical protein
MLAERKPNGDRRDSRLKSHPVAAVAQFMSARSQHDETGPLSPRAAKHFNQHYCSPGLPNVRLANFRLADWQILSGSRVGRI